MCKNVQECLDPLLLSLAKPMRLTVYAWGRDP